LVDLCRADGQVGRHECACVFVGLEQSGDQQVVVGADVLVLRVLASRIYLGELSFRDIMTTNCHEPLVTADTFTKAARILAERGEDHSHRAVTGSDYTMTGRIRSPKCDKAMIGTRATGKTQTYRYYTSFTRSRYGTDHCDADRINADALEPAVLDAMGSFYRRHHDVIADTDRDSQQSELDIVDKQLATTNAAMDRYLTAFENGTLDDALLAERLAGLRVKAKQLVRRRDELTEALAAAPVQPTPADLNEVADYITEIIATGERHHAQDPHRDPGRRNQGHRTERGRPDLPHPPTTTHKHSRTRRKGRNQRKTAGHDPFDKSSRND
jgi:site-specific DNA recombinase